jgi:hypothetical protein
MKTMGCRGSLERLAMAAASDLERASRRRSRIRKHSDPMTRVDSGNVWQVVNVDHHPKLPPMLDEREPLMGTRLRCQHLRNLLFAWIPWVP